MTTYSGSAPATPTGAGLARSSKPAMWRPSDDEHGSMTAVGTQTVDDDDCVARARAGDAEAWRVLYGDVAGRLLQWLRTTHLTATRSDAEDVAGEAWLVAARRIHDFHGGRDDFAGWLFGIAHHVAVNERRKATRRATSPTDTFSYVDRLPDPAVRVSNDDLTARLLARLPAREAMVVACLDVVGLDVAGTAEALGISRGAVRVAHHRALGRLRSALALEHERDQQATAETSYAVSRARRARRAPPPPPPRPRAG